MDLQPCRGEGTDKRDEGDVPSRRGEIAGAMNEPRRDQRRGASEYRERHVIGNRDGAVAQFRRERVDKGDGQGPPEQIR